jgi:hypothetical protein
VSSFSNGYLDFVGKLSENSLLLKASLSGDYETLVEQAQQDTDFLEVFVFEEYPDLKFTSYDVAANEGCSRFIALEQERQFVEGIIKIADNQKNSTYLILSYLETLPEYFQHLKPIVSSLVDIYKEQANKNSSDHIINNSKIQINIVNSYKPEIYKDVDRIRYIPNLYQNSCYLGSIDLSYTDTTELPEEFEVKEYLNLEGTPITRLPRKLKVGEGFNLSYTNIAELPEGLYVGNTLNLTYCKNLAHLPKGLYVGHNLLLHGTNIAELPEDLRVKGEISLLNTPFSKKYKVSEIDTRIFDIRTVIQSLLQEKNDR